MRPGEALREFKSLKEFIAKEVDGTFEREFSTFWHLLGASLTKAYKGEAKVEEIQRLHDGVHDLLEHLLEHPKQSLLEEVEDLYNSKMDLPKRMNSRERTQAIAWLKERFVNSYGPDSLSEVEQIVNLNFAVPIFTLEVLSSENTTLSESVEELERLLKRVSNVDLEREELFKEAKKIYIEKTPGWKASGGKLHYPYPRCLDEANERSKIYPADIWIDAKADVHKHFKTWMGTPGKGK